MKADSPPPHASPFSVLLRHFPHWRTVWLPIAGVLATSVFQIACVFGFPFLNRLIFDSVLTTLDGSLLLQITFAIFLLVFFGTLFKVLMDYQIAHLRTKLVDILRRKSIGDLMELEYLEVLGRERGDSVLKMITEADSVADGLAALFRNAAHLLQLLIIAIVILVLDASLIWVMLAIMALYFVMALPLRGLEFRLGMQVGDLTGKLHSMLYELFPSIKTVKCENLQPYQIERLDRVLSRLPRLGMRQSLLAAYAKLGFLIPTRLAHLFILMFGFWRIRSGEYSIGTFTMIFWFIDIVLEPSAKLRESVRTLVGSSAAASRLKDLFAGRKDTDGPRKFGGLSSSIVLDKVSFTHLSGKPVMQDVSLEIPMGRKICIVGRSGAGKSTLVNLVSGLIRPTRGRILLDGIDMAQYSRASLRSHLALVSQDVFLFDGTLRRNIDLSGRLPDSRILEACRNAELGPFLERLPDGLSTRVGERGVLLSGGERQRVSLARALATGAGILIFDEATSALDPATEKRVMRNLRELEAQRGPFTLIAVAHRPIFVAGMDFAYVLEAGRVIESGTLDTLAGANGHYSRLFMTAK
jgi:ABC-type bacteriocin/lantibiotic exporter with double-glycine peptidase domain